MDSIEEKIKDALLLNDNDLLVSRLIDYYTKKQQGEFSTSIDKDALYNVGVINAVGKGMDQELVGKIIYYNKNIGTELNLKGLSHRSFDLISKSTILCYRLDQNINNY